MTSEQMKGQEVEAKQFEESHLMKCPNCGGKSFFMGQDFKAPKKNDDKSWKMVQEYIESGKVYYRGAK